MKKNILTLLIPIISFIIVIIFNSIIEPDNYNENIFGEKTEKGIYRVVDVIDGDTVKIDYNGTVESVRLIGIDTPERKECFNEEATKRMEALVYNKYVETETDPTQGERDKYNRLLLFIWFGNELINEKMIEEGYAFEYTYNLPYKYQKDFQKAELYAQVKQLGLWGEICDY